MNILHISKDEKFIDKAIKTFNSFHDISNTFIVLSNALKYISQRDEVLLYSLPELIKSCMFGELDKYDVIVFHALTIEHKIILRLLKKRHGQKIVWIGFGFDYYNYSNEPMTMDDYVKNCSFKIKVKKSLVTLVKKIIGLENVYHKVDYFSPVIQSEYPLFKKLINFDAKYLDWDYGSTFSTLHSFKGKKATGDNILLGNSATETNNHISALNIINSLAGSREIIIPLSYGDNNYKTWLKNELKGFDMKFKVLDGFMPIDDYFNVLLGCQYVVMNHVRQQALGNIIVMLSLGAKVFLQKKNPLFIELKNLGFVIYSIDDIEQDSFTPLSKENQDKNVELTHQLYNDERINEKTLNFIKELKDNAANIAP